MSSPTPRTGFLPFLEHAAGALACFAALVGVADIAAPIEARLDFQGDIEWMEGATLVTAERLRDGLPIYGDPTPEYIPFIYPPLYAWVVSLLSQLWPLGYTLGRWVSLVSIGVAAAAGVFGARRAGAGWLAALSSVGLLAACWDNSGTFYDLVRTDSISLALLGWAIVLGNGPTARWSIASGLVLALAFTAKQHAALVGIPIGLWTWREYGWRRAATFAAASAVPALVYSVVMIVATGGAYWTWIATIATEHGIVIDRMAPGAQIECWEALPWTTTALLLLPYWLRRQSYWTGIFLTILVIVSLMRGHTGGYLNVLMPMFWLLTILPFIAFGAVHHPKWAPIVRIGGSLLVALQLLFVHVDPGKFRDSVGHGVPLVTAWDRAVVSYARHTPTAEDRVAAAKIVEELRELPDPILLPHGPWYARMAGKRTSFALITMWDINHNGGRFEADARKIDAALASGYFPSAVVPDDKLGHGFKDHFRKVRALKTRSVSARTGWPVKLKTIWEYAPDAGAAVEAPSDDAPDPSAATAP